MYRSEGKCEVWCGKRWGEMCRGEGSVVKGEERVDAVWGVWQGAGKVWGRVGEG